MKVVALLTLVAGLAACGGSESFDSGIQGRAVIASCGVPFTEAECQNPPAYEGEINVRRTLDGPVVAKIRTGPDGRFRLELEPGSYVLDWDGAPFPILKPVRVTVPDDAFAQITLSLASGIQ